MRIAILEDDLAQADLLASIIHSIGHNSHKFSTLSALRRALTYETFDLLVLDWMLPDGTGVELIKWFRAAQGNDTPILLATCKADEKDVVEGLNAGADDYVVKPIRVAEMIARINALVRRRVGRKLSPVLEMGPYRFDTLARKVTIKGESVELTPREFDLCLVLFKNVGRLLSRSYLLETAWRVKGDLDSRSLDTHISRIRIKLALKEPSEFRLVSVYSCGYRIELTAPDESGQPHDPLPLAA